MQNDNMKIILFLLSTFFLGSIAGPPPSTLNSQQINVLLHYHNFSKSCLTTKSVESCKEVRLSPKEIAGQPQAKGMFEYVWDAELAGIAQDWADACVFGHDYRFDHSVFVQDMGQNLAQATGPLDLFLLFNGWLDEHKIYTYGPYVDGPYGHYTQVMWASSYKLGCGLTRCSNGWINLICNYSNSGNWLGQYPYKLAEGANLQQACLSAGHAVSTRYPGLCVHQGADVPSRSLSTPKYPIAPQGQGSPQSQGSPTNAPYIDPSQFSKQQPPSPLQSQAGQKNPSYIPPQARASYTGAPNTFASAPQGGAQPMDPAAFLSGIFGGQMPPTANQRRQSWSGYPQQGSFGGQMPQTAYQHSQYSPAYTQPGANRSGGQYGGYQGSQQPVSNNNDEPQIRELTPEEEAEYDRQQQQQKQQLQAQQPQTQLVRYAPQQGRQPKPSSGGPYGYQPQSPQYQQYSSPPGSTDNQGGPDPFQNGYTYKATATLSSNGQGPVTYSFSNSGPVPMSGDPMASFKGWNRQSQPPPQPAPQPQARRRQPQQPGDWQSTTYTQTGGIRYTQSSPNGAPQEVQWQASVPSGMPEYLMNHMVGHVINNLPQFRGF